MWNRTKSEPKIMKSLFSRFAKDESGATAIEYGLIAALVAVAIITALTTMGDSLKNTFNFVGNSLNNANTSGN
jgi:pilus assembly protein Flp/PilA